MFNIENRRYVGNKFKLMDWIQSTMAQECPNCDSIFDVFAGTGAVSKCLLNNYNSFIINDFLYSNEAIYRGFFENSNYSEKKINKLKVKYNNLNLDKNTYSNYVSKNYGDKFFSLHDALTIGYIRQDIEDLYTSNQLSQKEYYILLASLIYSADRIANTVGHYDAYIKNKLIREGFVFDLISPLDVKNKKIQIFRKDSNELVKRIKCDIAFIDPPYNSRQYSRFYHVLETITKWDNPKLYGTAMKPKQENMSEYCKSSAPKAFEDLVKNITAKYIVVTYNNTYTSKSSSSKNKITFEQIKQILSQKGQTKIFEKPYRFFNAGKTDFADHKEFLFITKVEQL